MTYEEACAQHRWDVPERYNIAADVCDKHPRDKLAMVHERFDGAAARRDLGRAAGPRGPGGPRAAPRPASSAATAWRSCCRRRPRRPAVFFGTWKLGAILLSMSVLYGDDGIRHRLRGLRRDGARHRRAPTRRASPTRRCACSCSTTACSTAAPTEHDTADTAADDPAQLYYTSGTTGLAKGIVHAHRYILAHEEFVYCHEVQRRRALPRDGRVGVGGGHRAAARAVAAGRRAVRLPARGRLRPAQAARLPVAPRGHERLHDADRDARDDGHRRRRHALPAALPPRLLGRRAAEPRGDPLVPRAVRADRARLLRPHRVLSAVRELPVHGGARGLDGQADARLGRAAARRGRAARRPGRARRDLPARAVQPALAARLLAQRGGDARRPSAASGSTRRTPRRRTRTATSGTPGAPTT